MTLGSQLIAIQTLIAGDALGYHERWRCPETMHVGIMSLGYGDGFQHIAPAGAPVLVNGQQVADMLTVDLCP